VEAPGHSEEGVVRFFYVRQHFPSLAWQVVTIDQRQAEDMRARGTGYVFEDAKQAHAACDRLNRARGAA